MFPLIFTSAFIFVILYSAPTPEITHTRPRPFSKIKWSVPLNYPLNCHHLRFRDIHSFSFSCFAVLTDQNSEKPQFPSESLSSWQRALFVKYGLWSSGVHWCFQGLFQPGGPAGFYVVSQALLTGPNAPITTGTVSVLRPLILEISISRSLYFDSFLIILTDAFRLLLSILLLWKIWTQESFQK